MRKLKDEVRFCTDANVEYDYQAIMQVILNKNDRAKLDNADLIRFDDHEVVRKGLVGNVYMIQSFATTEAAAIDLMWINFTQLRRLLDREYHTMVVGRHFTEDGKRGVISFVKAINKPASDVKIIDVQQRAIALSVVVNLGYKLAAKLHTATEQLEEKNIGLFQNVMYDGISDLEDIHTHWGKLIELGGILDDERSSNS